jgi:uncharacterized damage-inducible protein DinB
MKRPGKVINLRQVVLLFINAPYPVLLAQDVLSYDKLLKMNTEINLIITSLKDVLSGKPWYGKSVLTLLDEVNIEIVFMKFNNNPHSIMDLLYHMVTWTEFTRRRLEKDHFLDVQAFELLDWRETDFEIHTWNNGISQFKAETNKIIEILNHTNDDILEEKVEYREYNFRYLLNGLIQHNIYHLGQTAYINKM